MSIFDGNMQDRRVFFGNSPVREIYEGNRKIIGFNNVTPTTNDFSCSDGAEVEQGNGLIVVSIPELEDIRGKAQTVDFCDDITICPFNGGITFTDMTGGEEMLSVAYLGESSGLTQKYYLQITYKGNQVYKADKTVYTTSRIRVFYDFSVKKLKIYFDSELLYETPQIEWRLWQVDFILSFYYTPPQVVGTTFIPGMYLGGWVQIFNMTKAVGYPKAIT